MISFIYQESESWLGPFQFSVFNFGTNELDFNYVIESEYDNIGLSFNERFPSLCVQDFYVKISKEYRKLNFQFMDKYITIKDIILFYKPGPKFLN